MTIIHIISMIESIENLNRSQIEKNNCLHEKILLFLSKNELKLNWVSNFKQIIYHFRYDLKYIPVCYCGKQCNFKSYRLGYRKTCSQQCSNASADKLSKIKQVKLEKYGDENYNNTSKNKQTKLNRYGDENYNNREGAAETCVELYGASHHNKNIEISSKIKQTKLERYGDENYNNVEKIKEFYKTCGDEYLLNFTSKIKQTKLERYGDENYNNPDSASIRHFNNKSNMAHDVDVEFIGFDVGSYEFRCVKCNSNFNISQTMFYLRKSKNERICTYCNPKHQPLM